MFACVFIQAVCFLCVCCCEVCYVLCSAMRCVCCVYVCFTVFQCVFFHLCLFHYMCVPPVPAFHDVFVPAVHVFSLRLFLLCLCYTICVCSAVSLLPCVFCCICIFPLCVCVPVVSVLPCSVCSQCVYVSPCVWSGSAVEHVFIYPTIKFEDSSRDLKINYRNRHLTPS